MGVDTYMIVPTDRPYDARTMFGPDERVEVGADFVAVYCGERFSDVSADRAHWGAQYAASVPTELRRRLDRRGLLVVPEVGQVFAAESYRGLAAGDGAVWLPVASVDDGRARLPRLLLIPLSEARAAMLRDEPALARDLIDERHAQPVPGALELGPDYVGLQRKLLDHADRTGAAAETATVLPPVTGLLLYQDRTVDRARAIDPDTVRSLADWLATVSPSDLPTGELTSASALAFPDSLGTAPADDHEGPLPLPPAPDRPRASSLLSRVTAFYRAAADDGRGLLAICFRGRGASGATER